jgi:acetyltransferase-like isoleucine patch superfamily enzyme
VNRTLRKAVERLIGRLKRDSSYRLDGNYTNGDLVELVMRRAGEATRGAFLARRAREAAWPIFSGRHVRLQHGRLATIGRASIVGDDVLMNALSSDGLHLGANVTIGRGTTLTCTGVFSRPGVGIRVGDRTGIGEYSHIGGQGGVEIGNDVLFGPGIRIFSENHEFAAADRLIRTQGERRGRVTIGDDCWFGAGVTILAGVSIGSGCVVGAGSVVTSDIPARSVAVGVPARVISTRGIASGELEK